MASRYPDGAGSSSERNEADAPSVSGMNVNTAIFILLAIAALYFGQDIFVPFTLAVLLSFMLAPPVLWLRRIGLSRVIAVMLVVATAVAFIGGISALVGTQVVALANNLPAYQSTMLQKIRNFRASAAGEGVVDRTTTVIKNLGRELSEDDEAETRQVVPKSRPESEPLPVRIELPEQTPLEILRGVMGSAVGPIATAGLVIVFVFFVLLSPGDLRDRLIRLTGSEFHRSTEAMNDAAARVGRYLLMQLVVNASYGIPLGIGLYLIGVPGAFLWALMATLLRFIPYLGPVIAALFPLTMAFAVDPGWSMFFWALALVLVLELISNNVIEPWLYGSSTGITPMAVILSAIFWTLLWGPVGLILATPLTVCLVVVGRYVPQLKFIEVLLGNEPVLSCDERLYQRLLAGNVEEAVDIAETEVESGSLMEFYDGAAMPALRLAEGDRARGTSKEDRRHVSDGFRTMVLALKELERASGERQDQQAHWPGSPVLCIAGRGDLDAAAALLLAHVLEDRGIGVRLASAADITVESIRDLDLAGVEVVCLSYLSPNPKAYARFVCRRLKPRLPDLRIVLGTWNLGPEAGTGARFAVEAGADAGGTRVEEVAAIIETLVGHTATPAMPPPLPVEEEARLAALDALKTSGALSPENCESFDRVARNVAEAMDAPIGLVSLIDNTCQLWKGAAGLPDDLEEARQGARELSVCTHVVASDAPLVVEDIARDRRFANNPFLRRHGMRFYAGVPLRTKSGHVIGSLCVIDMKPRTISAREIGLMQIIADALMSERGFQGLAEPELPGAGLIGRDGLPPLQTPV